MKFRNFVHVLSEWSGKIFSFVFLIVIIVITIGVVARYVFHAPLVWTYETLTYLSGTTYIMGGAFALLLGAHVSVDILHRRISQRKKIILNLIGYPLLFLFCGVLLWFGIKGAYTSVRLLETSGTVWDFPVYPLKCLIPIGAFLILLEGVTKFIDDLRALVKGGSPV